MNRNSFVPGELYKVTFGDNLCDRNHGHWVGTIKDANAVVMYLGMAKLGGRTLSDWHVVLYDETVYLMWHGSLVEKMSAND